MRRKKLIAVVLAVCMVFTGIGMIPAFGVENSTNIGSDKATAEPEVSEDENLANDSSEACLNTHEDATDVESSDVSEDIGCLADNGTVIVDDMSDKASPAKETTKALEENSLDVVYVSAHGNDEGGAGTESNPVATLSKAVSVAKSGATIYVMSDITATETARYYDKDLTIKSVDGQQFTISRGEDFKPISDTARSWYNGAMLEVGSISGPSDAYLRLENIILDDGGRKAGAYYIQADSDGDGNTHFGSEDIGHLGIVQDAIIATYNGTASITLGNGAVLKNFGGMSAVRLSGGEFTMESGSCIYDDTVTDRTKGTDIKGADKALYGPAGAVWMQGGTFTMDKGAVIGDNDSATIGRAVYIDGGHADINGTIQNLKGDLDMWQGESGVAIHTRNGGWAVLGETGVIDTVTGEHAGYRGAVMTNGSRDAEHKLYDFEAKPGSVIKNITGINAVFSNYGTEFLNGTITNCTNDYIIGGFAQCTTIGEKGIVENCDASKGAAKSIVYTSNASDVHMKGTVRNNKVGSAAFYIINQSGGGAELWIYDGAVIEGTGGNYGVYVNASESKAYMEGGKISGFNYGVYCRGKSGRDATFIMNGGEISGNSYGVYFSVASGSESIVDINGGIIKDNSSKEISASGGYAQDKFERTNIASGVVQGSRTVGVSFGTLVLDEGYADVGLGGARPEAISKIKELVAADEKYKGWTVAGSSALWIKPSEETVHFSMERPSGVKHTGLFAAYIPLTAEGLPQDDAEIQMVEIENEKQLDVTMEGLKPGASYALMFINNDEYTLVPDDITIYTGGGQGDEIYDNGGLPEWTLENCLDDIDTLEINGKDSGLSDETEMMKALKELFTVSYIDENGEEIKNDTAAGEYRVKIELKDKDTKIRINGNEVKIGESGELIVRYIDNIEGAQKGTTTHPILTEAPTEKVEHAEAVANKYLGISEPKYYVNDDEERKIIDVSGVSLLDDSLLIENGNDNRQELMEQKAEAYLGAADSGRAYKYDFHYLDLVDAFNGNAWVSASYGTTVYLPYPEGINAENAEEFDVKVIHYKDLHREYGISGNAEVEEAIAASELETMDVTFDANGIKFDVPREGFSPFAVVWQTKAHTITASAGEGGVVDPVGEVVVAEGTDQTFTITPDKSHEISKIAVDDLAVDIADIVNEDGTGIYTFSDVNADHSIAVEFTKTDESTTDPGDGEKPNEPGEPSGGQDSNDNQSGNSDKDQGKDITETGDETPVILLAMMLITAGAAAAVIFRKRQNH